METNTLREHIDYLIQCTGELQLSHYQFNRYSVRYEEIFQYCTEHELTIFERQHAEDFCKQKCLVSKKYMEKEIRKIAYTVAEYFKTGVFTWKAVTIQRYPISEQYEELMSRFQSELLKTLGTGTVRVSMVIIKQFLYFLENEGVMDASSIEDNHVLNFIRNEAPNHKASMGKLLRTISKFIKFLRTENIVHLDADKFLTTAGKCRQKSLPCFTDEELMSIFAQIDRSCDKGKRDYAIFLTALRTGLRASDISKLKLSDINWIERTISVIQKKTKTALYLPLPVDVGNAIAEYILHSRYKTENPYIFLRLEKTTFMTPMDPTSFNGYLRKYMEAAGITRTGWDGKSFHALRRTAGTKMIMSGVPISTVSQILGHTNIESSKHYISLDTEKMRECCLDLGSMYTRKEGLI